MVLAFQSNGMHHLSTPTPKTVALPWNERFIFGISRILENTFSKVPSYHLSNLFMDNLSIDDNNSALGANVW